MDWFGIAALVISLVALGVAGWQMYMSRRRYRELKCTQDRILDFLHREFDVRLEGSTKFNTLEASVSVGKREAIKPTFLLTLRRLLGKLFP